jgi:homocysteine S-methyltransferase
MDPGSLLLTEGGLETWLVYHEGVALPHFAAFDLMRRPGGRAILERHYRSFAELGAREGVGVILETATWRASADWGARLGYDARQLEALHHELVELLLGVRASFEPSPAPILVAGCMGPRSDAYAPRVRMTVAEAAAYHGVQLATFAATPSTWSWRPRSATWRRRSAWRWRRVPAGAARALLHGRDGRPAAERPGVGEAIEQVDAATGGRVAYYMINCAHPSHVARGLEPDAPGCTACAACEPTPRPRATPNSTRPRPWTRATPTTSRRLRRLRARWPTLSVVGGCCGTDRRHVERIVRALAG